MLKAIWKDTVKHFREARQSLKHPYFDKFSAKEFKLSRSLKKFTQPNELIKHFIVKPK